MARPLRIEFAGAVCHVTGRGNERREVFRGDEDRRLFLSTLGRTVARWRWVVHAYCLMGNHYHLVIETPEANLSRGMRQLNGEYTQAFNRLHRFVAEGMGRELQMDERPGMWIGSEGFGERLQALARGKEDVLDHPRRQRRPSRRELSDYLPLDGCEDRAARDEAIFRAYMEGRFTQREIGDHLGLH
jgi:REP element-mobilizing transposase RayT